MREMKQISHRNYPLSALTLLILSVAGCASIPDTSGTPNADATNERAASHAEQVFRYQSRVADALLDHYPLLDVFAGADPALISAEAAMTGACGALTQAVLARIEGREPSLLLRLEVMSTLDECERATQRTEQLLPVASETDAPSI